MSHGFIICAYGEGYRSTIASLYIFRRFFLIFFYYLNFGLNEFNWTLFLSFVFPFLRYCLLLLLFFLHRTHKKVLYVLCRCCSVALFAYIYIAIVRFFFGLLLFFRSFLGFKNKFCLWLFSLFLFIWRKRRRKS